MSEFTESVKRVRALLMSSAEKLRDKNPEIALEREGMASDMEAVEAELMRLAGLTSALPPDLGNVFDLPEELLAELSIAKGDELEDQLVTVVNSYGGEASLDQILVGLFRKFKVTQKRRFLQNKLYRMTSIWSIDGRKGVYTTRNPEHVDPSDFDSEPVRAGKKAFEFDTGDDDDSEIPF